MDLTSQKTPKNRTHLAWLEVGIYAFYNTHKCSYLYIHDIFKWYCRKPGGSESVIQFDVVDLFVEILALFPDMFVLSCHLQLKPKAIGLGKRAQTDNGPGYGNTNKTTRIIWKWMNVDFSLYHANAIFDNIELNSDRFGTTMMERHDLCDDITPTERWAKGSHNKDYVLILPI